MVNVKLNNFKISFRIFHLNVVDDKRTILCVEIKENNGGDFTKNSTFVYKRTFKSLYKVKGMNIHLKLFLNLNTHVYLWHHAHKGTWKLVLGVLLFITF